MKNNHYKFRGMNALKQWHTGYLLTKGNSCYIRHHSVDNYVYKATIGQAIGKRDTNGKDIFQDDIVKMMGKYYIVQWVPELYAFQLYSIKECLLFPIVITMKIEVVGNIHENKIEEFR